MLVRFFAAFAFADKKSLGYDPTIQPVGKLPLQFIITVFPNNDTQHPKRFQTTDVISSYGAEPLRGRGTRVFEATELDSKGDKKGPSVVLKDIWIDSDRTREGTILRTLYDEADEKDKKLVEKYFLTTVCHGDVWMEPGVLDDTGNGLMRGLDVTTYGTFELQRKNSVVEKHVSGPGSEGLRATSRLHVPHLNLTYAHKTHYRIVFVERGTTIDLIPSLPDVMSTLSGTASGASSCYHCRLRSLTFFHPALQLLRKLGWVHRDVSIGNILEYEGGAKLADLEYAKRVGDLKRHEMRTASASSIS